MQTAMWGPQRGRAAGLRDLVLATPHHLQRRLPKQIEGLAAAAHVSPLQQNPVLLVHPPAIRKHDDSSTVRLLAMALVLLASAWHTTGKQCCLNQMYNQMYMETCSWGQQMPELEAAALTICGVLVAGAPGAAGAELPPAAV